MKIEFKVGDIVVAKYTICEDRNMAFPGQYYKILYINEWSNSLHLVFLNTGVTVGSFSPKHFKLGYVEMRDNTIEDILR